LADFKEEILSRDFWKNSNIKHQENPFCGSRIGPCGKTDWQTNRQIWQR